MNLRISKRANKLIESPIRKFLPLVRQAEKKGVEVLKLNVGDPDIQAPKDILGAIKGYKDKNVCYAPSVGIQEHVQAWLEYFKKYGVKLSSDNVIPANGASEAFMFVLDAICNPGDEIIVFEPFYTNFKALAALCDVKLVPVSLKLENGFSLPDSRLIRKKITKKTKAILIIDPDNPTGKVYSQAELNLIKKIAKQYNLYLIADETYREIVFNSQPITLLSDKSLKDSLIVIDSLSKRFSVPGIRLGAVVSYNMEVMGVILKMAMARLSAPTIGQLATVDILKKSKLYTDKIKVEYKRRRDVVNQELKKIKGVVSFEPQGAFYQVVRLPIKDSQDFIRYLLTKFRYRNKTILLTPMNDFYITPNQGKNEIRIAYVLNKQSLKQGMDILRRGLEEYAK